MLDFPLDFPPEPECYSGPTVEPPEPECYNNYRFDISNIYIDQVPHYGNFVSSVYLEKGIKEIDSGFAKRIMNLNEDYKKLEIEIQNNPHLHTMIKDNLIQNLKRYMKEKL